MSKNTLDVNLIKSLRSETGAGVMDIKHALEEAGGDTKKAKELLQKAGFEKAEKKSQRETSDGSVFSYVHATTKVGSMVVLRCETDFVAKTEGFKNLGKEIAMHITATNPKDIKDLMSQVYIRDSSRTIEVLVKEIIAKTGENVRVGEFTRLEV